MKIALTTTGMLVATVLACVTVFASGSESKEASSRASEISVMAYNVENFFDEIKDNVFDITFIPLALKNTPEHRAECQKITGNFFRDQCNSLDWNTSVVETKIDRIANVIASIENGNGPDILILEEVENVRVLGRLMEAINKKIPADKAYLEPILLEGWDTRGIDVGMLSRLKRAKETTITPVKLNGTILDSRGILHSVFALPDGQNINVFGIHFPSGGNPIDHRIAAIDALNVELAKLPNGELAITGGDFNINSAEEAKNKLFSDRLGSQWLVSHLIGCKQCVGTEYYGKDDQWSFLDALLFTKTMAPETHSGWVVDEQSIDVPNNGPEQTWKGHPNRFDVQHGVSDHWPVYAKIRKN